MNAFGFFSRSVTALSLLAVLSACSSTDTKGALNITPNTKASANTEQAGVVEGNCPKIVLREGTAYHDVYARGAKTMPDGSKDQKKLKYQASISATTRECRITDNGMVITVQAAGVLVEGPAGGKGNVKLPIRVAVVDDKSLLYSQLTQFETSLPTDRVSTQFIFSKNDVTVPAGLSSLTTIFIGFDNGPAKKKR